MVSGMPTFPRRVFLVGSGFALGAWKLGGQAPSRQSLIDDLVAANRILYAKGIVDGFGHVSVRIGPARFLLARSIAPAQVTAADIVEYDLDGHSPGDTRAGYRERFIHSEIYRARADVVSVVHCHAPALIPFGITRVAMRPVFHNSSFVGEGIPVFEIRATAGESTDMLVDSPELGKALAHTLGQKPAALMRGHGAVVVGRSVEESVARSVYLEVNARVQAQALAMGGPVNYLTEGEVKQRSGPNEYTRAWELWKQEVRELTAPTGASRSAPRTLP
jgi:ribulose-5-phosphate 4-epimerase/fuculose-1-phosphate aldolase